MSTTNPAWCDSPDNQDFYGAALREAVANRIPFPESEYVAELAAAREALEDATSAIYMHKG